MQKIIVFLGPSLDHVSAGKILAAEYRPPAKRGDILSAVADGATVIGLIDGVFHQDCAVAHREVMHAIKKGVKVIGASSMGALRAAELDTLGMVGIGEIYRQYAAKELESDDEVALIFDPETYIPLSEPLVNIRCSLNRAQAAGIITPDLHATLLSAARSVFYPQRTWSHILSVAGDSIDAGTRERFVSWMKTASCDQKKEDAIAALEYIRDSASEELE